MNRGIGHDNSDYVNSNLTFHQDTSGSDYKITSDLFEEEIMMDWESNIMSEHADIVCHNQGDVLEIGFGLGISAGYIQSLNPTTHTIIEIHPDIYAKLVIWAADKPNVIPVLGDWYDIQDTLGQFDGIFYDTIYDVYFSDFMNNFVSAHMKTGGKFTYFNHGVDIDEFSLGATFNSVAVTPDDNGYFNSNTYYVPTVQY